MSISTGSLIDVKAAAKIIGCSEGAFRNYIKKGSLKPYKKISGKNFFSIEAIRKFSPPSSYTRKKISVPNQKKSKDFDASKMREIIDKWKVTSYDSSSCDVHIGIYTEKISQLEAEMQCISRDNLDFLNMRKLLVKYVVERRRLLNYLQSSNYLRYKRALKLINQ